MATLSELLTRALQVYNEQVENMNSNVRIGSLFRDIVDFLDTKQDKETGKGLSTNDFSNADKANLNTLVALLSDNPDDVVNTISEVLKVLESYPEGVKVIDLLGDKLDKGDFEGTAEDLAIRGDTSKTLSDVDFIASNASESVNDFKKSVKTDFQKDTYYISDTSGKVLAKFNQEGLHITSISIYKNLVQSGIIDDDFFNIIANKLDKGSYPGTAENLFNSVSEVAGLNAVVKKDILDSSTSGAENNYKGQYIISDSSGNVVFWIKEDGTILADIQQSTLTYQEINSTTAKVDSTNKYDKVFFQSSRLAGKSMLAIGDSLTAANIWQVKCASILGMTQSTHALGGAGIITFVDGGTNTNGTLAALAASDVANKDVIVILGPYNSRGLMSNIGAKTDMYPTNNTLWGQMNYLFKRIYQELANASNMKCKVYFAGVHAFGKYQYIDASAYDEFPVGSGKTGEDFANTLQVICGYNSVEYIDLFHGLGINKYTWNTFQNNSQPNATNYIGYVNGRGAGVNDPFPDLSTLEGSITSSGFINGDRATVTGVTGYYTYNGTTFVVTTISNYYPWLADQLHCNTDGYNLIGTHISKMLN